MKAWIHAYAAWLYRNCLAISICSMLLMLVGGFYSIKLYKNLKADLEELLPAKAQSVIDLKAVQGRLKGMNHLEVVIETNDSEAGRRLQLDLAKGFETIPESIRGEVKAGIKEEMDFFNRNKALYIDLADWQSALRFVKKKVGRAAFDLGLDDEDDSKLDFKSLKQKYSSRTSLFAQFKEGLFQSADGKTRFILVFMPGNATDMHANKALSQAAEEQIKKINLASYAPDIKVGLGGDVQNVVDEHDGLVHDLISSFLIVTLLVIAVLLIFFRNVQAVVFLNLALFVGVALTFGLSYFLVGYLNANTAFLGSIVIGNGINFGVILMARYLEERSFGVDPLTSMTTSFEGTVHATVAAAGAAGLAYGSLVITSFRGFNQFGIIGFFGMLFCWITAYSCLPAFLFAWERFSPSKKLPVRPTFPIMGRLALLVEKRHRSVTYVTLAVSAVAILGAAQLSKNTIETDLTKLRNKESMQHGSGFWGKKVDVILGRSLTPTIVLTDNPADARTVYTEIMRLHNQEGAHSPFSQVAIVEDYLPTQQEKKLNAMRALKQVLSPKVMSSLGEDERSQVQELLEPMPHSMNVKDLPAALLTPFQETNHRTGNIVQVYPHVDTAANGQKSTGTWDGEEVIRYTELLRQAITNTGVKAAIAGQPPVSADMLSSIVHDGPRATLSALLLVIALVFLLFPNFRHSTAIILSLLVGVLFTVGVMGFESWKINFLNFIALPITFGIGVDYAVNILGRYREERRRGSRSMMKVIRHTGGAVVLSSITTIIGYSSLLLSGSQAFNSFGRLAVLGEVACVTTAVICMPAIWLTLRRERR
ncbi:MAG: efflux RND transporter permease subunit [Bdellovibrionota bacterium]